MRVRFTSSPGDSAAREAIPEENTLEYSLIDEIYSWRLGVLGEEIQNGRPRLVSWIVFGDVGQSIYTFDLNTCTSNPMGIAFIPSWPNALGLIFG